MKSSTNPTTEFGWRCGWKRTRCGSRKRKTNRFTT